MRLGTMEPTETLVTELRATPGDDVHLSDAAAPRQTRP